MFFTVGMHRMAVKQMRGQMISVGDLFSGSDGFPAVLGASILMGLAMIPAVLTIVGPYVLAGLWMLTIPLIIDQRIGAIEAMRRSWHALKGQWVMAALFYFVVAIIAGCGIYACGVGVLFSYPLLFLIHTIVYSDFFNPPGMYPGPNSYTDVSYPVSPPPNAGYAPPSAGYPPPYPGYQPPPTSNPPPGYPPKPPPPPPAGRNE